MDSSEAVQPPAGYLDAHLNQSGFDFRASDEWGEQEQRHTIPSQLSTTTCTGGTDGVSSTSQKNTTSHSPQIILSQSADSGANQAEDDLSSSVATVQMDGREGAISGCNRAELFTPGVETAGPDHIEIPSHSPGPAQLSTSNTVEGARQQPEAIPSHMHLCMPHDSHELRSIMERIEADHDLCFKMRWYIARHVRRYFHDGKAPSIQTYQRPIRRALILNKENSATPSQLPIVPFNRLDFEATRLQEGFRRHQRDWQRSRISRTLQMAYECYGWHEVVADAEADAILSKDVSVDITLYDKALAGGKPGDWHIYGPQVREDPGNMLHRGRPRNMSHNGSPRAPEPRIKQSIKGEPVQAQDQLQDLSQGTTHGPLRGSSQNLPQEVLYQGSSQASPSRGERPSPLHDEVYMLRVEVNKLKQSSQRDRLLLEATLASHTAEIEEILERERQLREKLAAENKIVNQTLMAEIHELREVTQGSKKRKRNDEKRSNRKAKLRKYIRKIKELDTESSSDESSSNPGP
ncbi:hypothetical protein F5Y15DRAFT_154534 [Xylariaceae sp. FL0016]|nr:hypothetical protein F5Y15DRAFT_154534 [Xylariaceae sp. FL0016]